MPSNIAFNPYLTTTALGTFSVQSDGYVQGTMLDDPSVRNYLAGGVLAATETLPMWGGVLLFEDIALTNNTSPLGPLLGRATSLTNGLGFSVFNQAVNWVTSPQSQCPSAGAGATVPFFRFGSSARIAVQCDPSLVSLNGGLTTQQVSWDFVNQRLIPYYPTEAAIAITSQTWSSTNGGQVAVVTAAANTLVVGSDIVITGAVPTAYSGTFTVNTVTDTTHFTYLLPAASTPGTNTTPGTIAAGGGALNVRVLETQIGNSKTVVYDAVNNFVNWNNSGSTAIILI